MERFDPKVFARSVICDNLQHIESDTGWALLYRQPIHEHIPYPSLSIAESVKRAFGKLCVTIPDISVIPLRAATSRLVTVLQSIASNALMDLLAVPMTPEHSLVGFYPVSCMKIIAEPLLVMINL